MKNYELLMIFKPNLDAEEVEKSLSKLDTLISGFKGKVLDTDKIGRKKLAYDIQKFRDGFFVSQILSIPADKIAELKKQLKLSDNVLRIMFLETQNTSLSAK